MNLIHAIRRPPSWPGRPASRWRPWPPRPPRWLAPGPGHLAGTSPRPSPASPQPAPSTTMARRRTVIALRLRPHTIQLCVCCHQNPAGFWVSRTGDQTVRRPWCLSCCQELDPGRYHMISFDGHGYRAGRSR